MISPVQVWFDGGSLVRIGQRRHTHGNHFESGLHSGTPLLILNIFGKFDSSNQIYLFNSNNK